MVQPAVEQADIDAEPQVEDCFYQIDEAQFESDGASLEFMIWKRLCWEGDCRFCKESDGDKPMLPVKTRNRRSIYAAIKRCAKLDSYIMVNMSVSEVVFRILLRVGNNPMRLSEIYEEIEQEWQEVMWMKSLSIGNLQRMLDADNEYRIRRTQT